MFNWGTLTVPQHLTQYYALLRLAMQGVFTATLAILLQFETVRVVTLAFFAGVVAFLAFSAGQVYHHANFFLSHELLPFLLNVPNELFVDDFGDHTRADGQTAFTNCEP